MIFNNFLEIVRDLIWVITHCKNTYFVSLLASNMTYTFSLFVFVFIKNVPASAFPVIESVEKSLLSWKTTCRSIFHCNYHLFSLKGSNNGLRIFRTVGILFTWCLDNLSHLPTVQYKKFHPLLRYLLISKNAPDTGPLYTRNN